MFEYTFPVRYYEADPMGIVHHSEYVRYFELGRNMWMESIGYTVNDCAADHIVFPVSAIELKYKYSAKFGDMLTVTVEIENFTGARIVIRQTIKKADGTICVEGKVTLGFINTETGRIMRCPDKLAGVIESQINE